MFSRLMITKHEQNAKNNAKSFCQTGADGECEVLTGNAENNPQL